MVKRFILLIDTLLQFKFTVFQIKSFGYWWTVSYEQLFEQFRMNNGS